MISCFTLLCAIQKSTLSKYYYIMKSTLKIAALVLAFAGLSVAANAQTTTSTSTSTTTKDGIRYSIGVEAGIPVGSLKDSHKWNLGGSVQAHPCCITIICNC
jgi:hypothetical protein